MKTFAVIMGSLVLIVAAGFLLVSYFGFGQQSIVVDKPQTTSSAPVVISEEPQNIEIPVPHENNPVQEDAIVPTVDPPVASKPVADTSSTTSHPSKPKPPASDTSSGGSNNPGGGQTKDGKIYMPGFGWIDDNGGGVDADVVDMDPNGNIIGY